MPLNRILRLALYVVLLTLFVSGAVWLGIDTDDPTLPGSWRSAATVLLQVHGGAAMIFLVLLGALIPLHMQGNWSRGRPRCSGVVLLTLNAILIVTAYALYYASEGLRAWAGDIHIAAGFGLPAVVVFHIWHGRREVARERALKAQAGQVEQSTPRA